MNETLGLIAQIVTSLITLIPLLIALIKYVKQSVKEKNWNNLLSLLFSLCVEAEQNFSEGAEKKQWVMSMVRASAKTINYDIDDEALSALIDSLIAVTAKVNV